MPRGTSPELAGSPEAWSLADLLPLAALIAVAVYVFAVLVRLFGRWRAARATNAVRSGDLLEFALLAARYSWAVERRFTESWKLMWTGRRPREIEPPPAPDAVARDGLDELCRLRAALGQVHRLYNAYATAPDVVEGRGQDRMQWWRDEYEKPILRACGEVRAAIADAALWRFPSLSISARQLEAVLVRAQTTRG